MHCFRKKNHMWWQRLFVMVIPVHSLIAPPRVTLPENVQNSTADGVSGAATLIPPPPIPPLIPPPLIPPPSITPPSIPPPKFHPPKFHPPQRPPSPFPLPPTSDSPKSLSFDGDIQEAVTVIGQQGVNHQNIHDRQRGFAQPSSVSTVSQATTQSATTTQAATTTDGDSPSQTTLRKRNDRRTSSLPLPSEAPTVNQNTTNALPTAEISTLNPPDALPTASPKESINKVTTENPPIEPLQNPPSINVPSEDIHSSIIGSSTIFVTTVQKSSESTATATTYPIPTNSLTPSVPFISPKTPVNIVALDNSIPLPAILGIICGVLVLALVAFFVVKRHLTRGSYMKKEMDEERRKSVSEIVLISNGEDANYYGGDELGIAALENSAQCSSSYGYGTPVLPNLNYIRPRDSYLPYRGSKLINQLSLSDFPEYSVDSPGVLDPAGTQRSHNLVTKAMHVATSDSNYSERASIVSSVMSFHQNSGRIESRNTSGDPQYSAA